jgi:hypothetical protein
MDIDRSVVPARSGLVKPKRIWISPAVVDLGAMRELTLLQGGSGGGVCAPPDPCP